MKHYAIPDVRDVRIEAGLLSDEARKVMDIVIPYQWEILNDRVEGAAPSRCVHNFKIAAARRRANSRDMCSRIRIWPSGWRRRRIR